MFRERIWKCAVVFLIICLMMNTTKAPASAARPVYRQAEPSAKQIALTFDDGPHPVQTKKILDILDRYGVQATFFMIGSNVEYYPCVAREVLARKHEVGNHTYSHRRLSKLDPSALREELDGCSDALQRICGHTPKLFRPPEGFLSDGVIRCSEMGEYALILWSIDTRDWETKDADRIVSVVLEQVKPGDIILMHDYVVNSKTPEALEILLPRLLALDYEFVTVSELIGRK